jgi:Flp pilus assembly protein TadG
MLKRSRTFARAHDGIAAVEFALIAPMLVMMFFGAVELFSALECRARVGRAAYTSADLTAQATSVSTADMSNVFSAANSILYPFPATSATIVVSSLVDDGSGVVKVAWSSAQNATPRAVGSTVSVPPDVIVSGSGGSVILAEVTYSFTPSVAYFLKSGIALTDNFYARPRRSLTVKHT